jgi:hypothetical protein
MAKHIGPKGVHITGPKAPRIEMIKPPVQKNVSKAPEMRIVTVPKKKSHY